MKIIRYNYADVYVNNVFEKRIKLGDRTNEKNQRLKDLFNSVKKASNMNYLNRYYIELKYE